MARNKIVPCLPQIHRGLKNPEIKGIVALPPEEIIKNIDEWREAHPEIASDPALNAYYEAIREDARKLLQQKSGKRNGKSRVVQPRDRKRRM